MIPQSFIQDLLNRIDIVEVVGRYVQLKKGGANFLGLCPFHNEKSPSFTVSPTKQFYHCFGCGAHGSAIGFLMDFSGLSYVDAIQELAQSCGLTVPQESRHLPPEQAAQRKAHSLSLNETMVRASNYYRQHLRGTRQAIDYLKGRGLSGEVAARFGLGYAPDGWQVLQTEFGDYGNDEIAKPLLECGLLIESEHGDSDGRHRRYDRFRNRIMFPIRNARGQIIGFGGRVLDGGEPKYLNSPETPLFSKGSELYGLFEARTAIREMGYALITEGYMDVAALAQLGFANAVATLGTACTPLHVQKLLRQTDTIVFAFDGDAAGRRAARRAMEATLPHLADNKIVRFLFLPAEHDPDSFVRQHGAEAFAAEVGQAMPLSRFLIKSVSEKRDLRQPEERARVQFDAKPLLQAMPPGALRLQIVRELATLTGSTAAEIESLCELRRAAAAGRRVASARAPRKPPAGLEQQLLKLLLRHPELVGMLPEEVRAQLSDPAQEHGDLLADLFARSLEHADGAGFAVFHEALRASPFSEAYEPLRMSALKDDMMPEEAEREFRGVVDKLLLRRLEAEQTAFAESLQRGAADPQAKERFRLLSERIKLLRGHLSKT